VCASREIITIENVTEEELWKGYKKRVRRDIRRGEKLGMKLKPISAREEIDILYELYRETIDRNKDYAAWTKDSLYAIYDVLYHAGCADIIFATLDNEYIASTIVIWDKDTLYYFMSASLTKSLRYCPNDALLHYAITSGIRKGKKQIDLMTSSGKDINLIKFKEKWGAQHYPFYIYERKINTLKYTLWRLGLCLKKIPFVYRIMNQMMNR